MAVPVTVVAPGRIMSIVNIQEASERGDTFQSQQGGGYDPYLTDNTGLLEA